ncbi:hypothetical protein [Clostridium oceanicum]|uniref:Tetratricopeptide repeat protein n=1 Tax=Clostridium oceanicum TaxID=1543 RepID=A0ABN1JAV6_9CLOT
MNKSDKSNKIYLKALKQYNNGYIDKSLDLCEKSISIDCKNSSAINLKGLLYYLNGDLIGCKKLWEMNYKNNKDEIANKYLKDIEDDKILLKYYTEAITYIRKSNYERAIVFLEKCEKSDFNYINVLNNLTKCYLKIGRNYKALEYNEKVLERDKNNLKANKLKKNFSNSGLDKKGKGKKVAVCSIISIIFICVMATTVYYFKFNPKKPLKAKKTDSKNVASSNLKKIKSNPKSNNIVKNNDKDKQKKPEKSENKKFDSNKVKKFIENKNFNELYSIYIYWKNRNLSINDKALLIKGETLLKKEGIEYFYKEGVEYSKSKDYDKSNEKLLKAYNFGKVNYLYSHIVYLLGNNYEKISDVSTSIKYYEKYINDFPRDSYSAEVLYKLAIMYEKIDNNKSKHYAERIDDIYSESMYNNSNIKRIINSN